MAVYVSNIIIPSGEDFEQTFFLEDISNNSSVDLTNYTLYSYLKKHPESLNVSTVFNVEILDFELGVIQLSLGSTITSQLKPGRYSYDILLDDGQKKKRVIEGSALVTGGVTKIN